MVRITHCHLPVHFNKTKKTKPKKLSMSIEKKRPEKLKPASPPSDGGSIFDAQPDPENKNITISSGPHLETVSGSGMSVSEVRRKFKDRLAIDAQSQAIVDGNPVDENYVMKVNENLMFVRHAGEKGASPRVVVEDTEASVVTPEGKPIKIPVRTMMERVTPSINTPILPNGIRAVLSRGKTTVMVWERPPAIQQLQWIAKDSPKDYGPGTKYRPVRIALPYLLIFAVFNWQQGFPVIARTDECFFRAEPLKSLNDEVCYPGLLNCSKYAREQAWQPLSWICTQYLRGNKGMQSKDAGQRLAAGFEAVRHCLLETAFNLSSEHHEGNSWYGASKHIDPRISSVEQWEQETKKDPLFVLDVPWIPSQRSVQDVADRIFGRTGATDTSVNNSNDLARIIING